MHSVLSQPPRQHVIAQPEASVWHWIPWSGQETRGHAHVPTHSAGEGHSALAMHDSLIATLRHRYSLAHTGTQFSRVRQQTSGSCEPLLLTHRSESEQPSLSCLVLQLS